MEIEIGMQPNCSELVVRLGDISTEEIKEELKKIGIEEYLIKNKYRYDKKDTEWDDESIEKKVLKTSELSKRVRKAWDTVYANVSEDKSQKADDILKEAGLSRATDDIILTDEENMTAMSDVGVWISNDPYEENSKAIWYHQHCQPQGFPLLRKIAAHFDSEVEAHDGGSINNYDEWNEEDNPNEWRGEDDE